MIPRIQKLEPIDGFKLRVTFDDGKMVIYDVNDDINNLPSYSDLRNVHGLFNQVRLDASRTCVYWNDKIDLASDSIYEYGVAVNR